MESFVRALAVRMEVLHVLTIGKPPIMFLVLEEDNSNSRTLDWLCLALKICCEGYSASLVATLTGL